MSEENLEVIRRVYRAMDARDLEALAELGDPDVMWIADESVGERPVHGREQVVSYFQERAEMFGEINTEIERLSDAGDKVIAFLHVTGSGVSSGAGFDIRLAHVWTLREGLVVRGEAFADRDRALEAAGLSE
jgi:ketosteroid isomerase-like protein